MSSRWDGLLEINRNHNGDYYFIFKVDGVKNHIRPGSKDRDEVVIVGVPQKRLKEFLEGNGSDFDIFKR